MALVGGITGLVNHTNIHRQFATFLPVNDQRLPSQPIFPRP